MKVSTVPLDTELLIPDFKKVDPALAIKAMAWIHDMNCETEFYVSDLAVFFRLSPEEARAVMALITDTSVWNPMLVETLKDDDDLIVFRRI